MQLNEYRVKALQRGGLFSILFIEPRFVYLRI